MRKGELIIWIIAMLLSGITAALVGGSFVVSFLIGVAYGILALVLSDVLLD